jgi:hypothetical protein
MSLMLDEDESFSMNAYVESPGYQTVALKGYLVEHRGDGTYVAPLIPELFYGANGNQLQGSWRQNLTSTGDQVILSRSGGKPMVPREELFWRKVETPTQPQREQPATTVTIAAVPNYWPTIAVIIGVGVAFYIGYKLAK